MIGSGKSLLATARRSSLLVCICSLVERVWDAMQPNRKIGEKHDEMGSKDGCKQTSRESRGGKTSRTQEKGKTTAEMGGLHEEGHEKIGGG